MSILSTNTKHNKTLPINYTPTTTFSSPYNLVSNSLKDRVKNAGISKEVFGSDHCPVWVEIA